MIGALGQALSGASAPASAPAPPFDPNTIPGVVFYLQTDNAVDDGAGACSSIDSLITGAAAFAQPTPGNRPTINTTAFPGHKVLECPDTATRFLRRTSAPMFGAFNGTGAISLGAFLYPNTPTFALSEFMLARQAAAPTSNRHRVLNVTPTFGCDLGRSGSAGTAGSTTYTRGGTVANAAWQLLGFNYATNAYELFVNGVSQGITPGGTLRTLANIDEMNLGSPNGGGSNNKWLCGGWFASTQPLNAAWQATILAAYQASFA
jgi:hypothetical protein